MFTETTEKHFFTYNLSNNRWPMSVESYPLLRKRLEEIFEYQKEILTDIYNNTGKFYCIPTGSIINRYGKKQQRKMLELLREYVLGDKEVEEGEQEDLILEELLYHIVTNDIESAYDMHQDKFCSETFNAWKEIFNASDDSDVTGEDEFTDEDILEGLNECLWWDLDWQIFGVKKKDYSSK